VDLIAEHPGWPVHRQVDDGWLPRYRGWVYGAGFGLQLGLGVVTIVTTAAVPAVWLLALLTASPSHGAAVGLAFQVVDDILDATAEAAQLGKTAGKDAAAGKATYVRLHGLEGARRIAADLRAQARDAIAPLGPRAALLDALATLIVDRNA